MKNKFVMIGRYVLDVTLSEEHTFESEVTEFPVESGGSFTDNIRPKPMRLTIEGLITNTPMGSNAATRSIIRDEATVFGENDPPDAITGEGFTRDGLIRNINFERDGAEVKHLPADLAYQYLRQIWESRDTVVVRTSLGVFEDMAMTSFSTPRNKETGDALRFTANFVQVQKITNTRLKSSQFGKTKRGHRATGIQEHLRIIWNIGSPPGSATIIGAVSVEYRFDIKTGGSWYFSAADVGGGKNAGNPLTPDQLNSFLIDRKRDLLFNDFQDTFLEHEEDTIRHATETGVTNAVTGNGKNLSRKPITDPSRMNRNKLKYGSGFDPLKDAFTRPFKKGGFQ